MEIFRDSGELLPLIRLNPTARDDNLIRIIFQEFSSKNPDRRAVAYWRRLLDVVELLNVLMFNRGNPLDINQFLISEELFGQGYYSRVFPPLRLQGERLLV